LTVSIIIPTYNREEFIEQCVESALNQTYKDIEVVVVDDGSTDNTLGLLRKYHNIKICIQKHKNTASAMNLGIKKAKGEWIKLLGSDDYLLPACIENFMKAVTNRDCIYYSDYFILKNNELKEYIAPEYPREKQYYELRRAFYGGCSFISNYIFHKFGYFDETYPYAEDYDYWLRLSSKVIELRHLPFYSTVYRIHEGQNTNKHGKSFDEVIKNKHPVS